MFQPLLYFQFRKFKSKLLKHSMTNKKIVNFFTENNYSVTKIPAEGISKV